MQRNDAFGGIVLISDGKESCGGDPAAEAAELAKRLADEFGAAKSDRKVEPSTLKSALKSAAVIGLLSLAHAASAQVAVIVNPKSAIANLRLK